MAADTKGKEDARIPIVPAVAVAAVVVVIMLYNRTAIAPVVPETMARRRIKALHVTAAIIVPAVRLAAIGAVVPVPLVIALTGVLVTAGPGVS